MLGGSNVLISDCWFAGTRSNLFNLPSGNLTFLGGLLALYSDCYGAGLPKSAAAAALNDFTGQADFIGVSLNLHTGTNGILMNSASGATEALFLRLSSIAAGFAHARSVVWETSPMAHTAGATDVRLFRIGAANTAIGLRVTN